MQVGQARSTTTRRRGVTTALATTVMLLAAATTACGDGDNPSRGEVLAALTEDVIVPTYRVVADRAAALTGDVRDACEDRADNGAFQRARGAWSLLRGSWSETRAFRFGPATRDPALSQLDVPEDRAALERLLAAPAVIPADTVADLPADQRSLPAIEYVLHRDVVLSLRACDYLDAASALIAEAAVRVLSEWDERPERGRSFADELTDPRPGGVYASEQDAYDELINGMLAAIDEVKVERIGKVSGDTPGGVSLGAADPGLGQRGRRDAMDMVVGVQRLYEGSRDGGLRDVVESVSPKSARQLSDALDDAIDEIEDLPQPLAIATKPGVADDAYEAIVQLETILRDVAAQLGVAVRPSRTG